MIVTIIKRTRAPLKLTQTSREGNAKYSMASNTAAIFSKTQIKNEGKEVL
ncbi:hypothetical protein T4A_13253 [Trichinella pseudospiralis]|uniref:Uncharacterized protein n=1 Tax=Trichinella pseudospiralis TaxID=6337 RepID=A0A0V1DMM5_TRIPS|nr:hypothetical protein T4A_13253 [Trichinella pseudospiralis]